MASQEEQLREYLEQMDFTQNDAIVYLFLLNKGISNPSDISKNTKVNRARIYDSLKRLIERGFVVQEIEKKRPYYMITNSHLILKELEDEIKNKAESLEALKKYFMKQTPTPRRKGVYFYKSDTALQLKLFELIQASREKITILAPFPATFKETDIFPLELLTEKSLAGQAVTLILNVTAKNWERCVDLFEKKISIFHFPNVKPSSTLIHLIDNNSIMISIFNTEEGQIILQRGLFFDEDLGFVDAFDLILEGSISKSISLRDRLVELEESIVYPNKKLKSIFGLEK